MTDILPSSNGAMTSGVDEDLAKARESLKLIDDGIRTLSGRPEFNNRSHPNLRLQQQFRGGNQQDASFALYTKRKLADDDEDGRPSPFKRLSLGYQQRGFEGEGRRNFQFKQNADSQAEYDDEPDFKPSLASSVSVTPKETKSRETAIAEMKENEKSDNKTRNKRMFNLLLGTLQRFKKDEDGKNHSSQEKRQREVERKLEEAKNQEQINLRAEKGKLFEKRRRQEQELKRLQRKKAVVAATENQINILRKLQNFIQTTTTPQIIFSPVKHTIRTIELQKKSQKRLEEIIKRKQDELEAELKIIDERKINVEAEYDDANDTSTTHDRETSRITIRSRVTTNGRQENPAANDDEVKSQQGAVASSEKFDDVEKEEDDDDDHERLLMQAAKAADCVHLLEDVQDEELKKEETKIDESMREEELEKEALLLEKGVEPNDKVDTDEVVESPKQVIEKEPDNLVTDENEESKIDMKESDEN